MSIGFSKFFISIHALRVEGDIILPRIRYDRRKISIHALRVEGDALRVRMGRSMRQISIHALRVEGDVSVLTFGLVAIISIHALRVEGDYRCGIIKCKDKKFLSTPSGWRATNPLLPEGFDLHYFYPRPPGGGRRDSGNYYPIGKPISIHALRVEGDLHL